MIPVNQDDTNTIKMVRAIIPWVGPFERDPERLSVHRNAGRTPKTRNKIHAMAVRRT